MLAPNNFHGLFRLKSFFQSPQKIFASSRFRCSCLGINSRADQIEHSAANG